MRIFFLFAIKKELSSFSNYTENSKIRKFPVLFPTTDTQCTRRLLHIASLALAYRTLHFTPKSAHSLKFPSKLNFSPFVLALFLPLPSRDRSTYAYRACTYSPSLSLLAEAIKTYTAMQSGRSRREQCASTDETSSRARVQARGRESIGRNRGGRKEEEGGREGKWEEGACARVGSFICICHCAGRSAAAVAGVEIPLSPFHSSRSLLSGSFLRCAATLSGIFFTSASVLYPPLSSEFFQYNGERGRESSSRLFALFLARAFGV